MTHTDVETVADAIAYIEEHRDSAMTREALHMLCEQFPRDVDELLRAAKSAGVRLRGPSGH